MQESKTHLFLSAHHQLMACASDCSQISMPSAELQGKGHTDLCAARRVFYIIVRRGTHV